MKPQTKKLFWQIINCGLTNCTNPLNKDCYPIYQSQSCASINSFHIPEPWNGNIEDSPILFLSINPGYSRDELYPRLGFPYWTKPGASGVSFDCDKVEDFFEHRFDETGYPRNPQYLQYVQHTNGHKFSIRMEDGTWHSLKGRAFWGYTKQIADKILGRDSIMGQDFALTELVHCKSKKTGVLSKGCFQQCALNCLNSILSVANNLEYIVVIGSPTKKHFCKHFKIPFPIVIYTWYVIKINGKPINLICVPHNAGGGTAKRIPVVPSNPIII